MVEKEENKQEIQISFPDAFKGGTYCNLLTVSHSKEEFIMTFMMVAPPVGSVTARVIMSPSHMKRTIAALQENIGKYEKTHGIITEAPEPEKGSIGFRPD